MQHHAKLSICTTGSFQHTKRNLVRYSKPTSITQKGPARVTSCGPLDACDTGTSCAAGPAGRPRADRLGPRTQTGTQGISPCGSYDAICAQPATPPIAIGAGPSGGPAAPLRPSRGGARRAAQKPKAGPKTRKGPQGAVPPRASLGAYRKAPSASATPCPPAASRCSTLGEGGLNCRVRDGTG